MLSQCTPSTLVTYPSLVASWERSLATANLSPETLRNYHAGVATFERFLEAQGMPLVATAISREHVETFIVAQLATHKPATVGTRIRALRLFFKWAVEEGEIPRSPLERVRDPKLVVQPPPVVADEVLRQLLATCEPGGGYDARRDAAVLRVLIDTGMRRSELAGIELDDVDWPRQVLLVHGKGGRDRGCPIGAKTCRALDRYVRVRARHPYADSAALWLGQRGPLTDAGVESILRHRCAQAGIEYLHPHLFRHTAAHRWLAAGGQEGDLQSIMGWRSRAMLGRYGQSAAAERAREAHKRLSLGDRL